MIRKKNIKRNPFLKPGGGLDLVEKFPAYKREDEIIEGFDVDKYLEAILKKYEIYIEKCDSHCLWKENQDKLLFKLQEESLMRYRFGDRRLKILNNYEKKIAEKQKKNEREREEKRKLLILAIKKIRR